MSRIPASPVVTAERESFGMDSSIKRSKKIFFLKIFLNIQNIFRARRESRSSLLASATGLALTEQNIANEAHFQCREGWQTK